MRRGNAGDSGAYHRLLKAITPFLRGVRRQRLARAGQPVDQSEDIVQEILLAVHLKRLPWAACAPFSPWLFAIARNKLVDALRRRGRRIFVNIEDFTETIVSEPVAETVPATDVTAHLQGLPRRQRDVLLSIAVESISIRATAAKLAMSEGAVRVALHRGLANLRCSATRTAPSLIASFAAVALIEMLSTAIDSSTSRCRLGRPCRCAVTSVAGTVSATGSLTMVSVKSSILTKIRRPRRRNASTSLLRAIANNHGENGAHAAQGSRFKCTASKISCTISSD